MGKISDAFERHQRERLIKLEDVKKAEDLKEERPRLLVREEPENRHAREIARNQSFSDSLVMLSSPESADAENFKILRGKILFSADRKVPRSILVTSTFPGEGKTFVACNLAASMAMSVDEYVLLIDADMRRAKVHRMFGFSNAHGLHDYLIGEKRFDDIVAKTGIEKLSIFPAGRVPRNPTELVSSNMMARFLEEAKQRYKDRFIIIDSPPSQITAEAKFLAQFVDGIIFVVLASKTPRKDAQKAIEGLGRDKILGVVFNGYDQARKSYYRYYDKYYKKG
jgi:protein-tyrosine kinase